jgi:hypothetical protein
LFAWQNFRKQESLYPVDYEKVRPLKPLKSLKSGIFFMTGVLFSLGCKKLITIFAIAKKDTGVAQLVEHWSPKPGVGRSSRSSRAKAALSGSFFVLRKVFGNLNPNSNRYDCRSFYTMFYRSDLS